MSFKFNPITAELDLVGSSSSASTDVLINPIVSNFTVLSPLIYLQHDMQLSGTLTLLGTSELLVI